MLRTLTNSALRSSRTLPSFLRVAPLRSYSVNANKDPIPTNKFTQTAEQHAESQHRAALTEEYADIEDSEKDEGEYYIDCSNIEQKWETLSYETQQDMISYLNVKQEFGWMYLSHDEKRAIYYIAYGQWGPRNQATMNMAESVFKLMTSGLLFVAVGFSLINYMKDKEEIAKLENSQQLSSQNEV